jgi:nitrogen fixation protein FixH
MIVENGFVTFFTRPEVLFCLGLVVVVMLLGAVFSRVRLTGARVFGIVVLFFGVVIAANLTMANRAISTFPGLEVSNSYVASQTFDAERTAQLALGWTLVPEYDAAAKELRLAFTDKDGYPAEVSNLSVLVGRTTEAREDVRPDFVRESGVFVAQVNMPIGKWMMQVEAAAPDGTAFRQRINLTVRN